MPDKVPWRTTRLRVQHDALRAGMHAKAYIRILEGIAGEALKKVHSLTAEEVAAMALSAKTYMGLLHKVLPDLKAVEHTGSIGRQPVNEMGLDELRAELIEVRAELSRAGYLVGSVAEPVEIHQLSVDRH